ncbi:MAG: ROK family protein [Acidimicrobiales bacterium]
MTDHPAHPFTLAIDVGGTGLKASVLDAAGALVADRVRVATTYPCPPSKLVDDLVALVAPLPPADRVAAGFPGMVRNGHILSASNFATEAGPGSDKDPDLVTAWNDFDLATALATRLGIPARVANDADVQGAAVVSGKGLELVITLGTGFGTALFYEGSLLPHMEFAHHPLRKDETYDEYVGDAARKDVGAERWNKRVRRAVDTMRALVFFDHCYLGGGNSKRVTGELPPDVTIVDNNAGILGGIKLWEASHIGVEPGAGG